MMKLNFKEGGGGALTVNVVVSGGFTLALVVITLTESIYFNTEFLTLGN